MSVVTVHYQPVIPPLRAAEGCDHAPEHAIVAGNRIETLGRKSAVTCDARLCLACGRIQPVAGEYRHYHDALADFWKKHGWHAGIGGRIAQFATLSTNSDVEAHVALQAGLSPKEFQKRFSHLRKTRRAKRVPRLGKTSKTKR